MANVDNTKGTFYLGIVVATLPKDDKVTVHAVNPIDPTSDDIPYFPTQRLSYNCQNAAEKKRGKEWKEGEVKNGVPVNGTPIRLEFIATVTDTGTEWRVDWTRTDV